MKAFLIVVGVVVGVFGVIVVVAFLTGSPLDSCLDAGGMMQDGKCIGERNSKTGD